MADITGTYPSSGELQGIISTASFIAGEVVGMRGLKGDKGDKGDTGDTGPQGAKGDKGDTGATGAKGDTGDKGDKGDKGDTGNDGYSPSASVSKVGNKATITITDKDGTTTADIYDGTGSGTVTDVTQNGTSVLDGTVAKVIVPTKVSDLTNDSGFVESSDLAEVATTGDYDDLTNKPTIPTVPTNVSAFTNDVGYLTSYTETDPTVPSWAKQSTKPTYTASEVGALPSTTIIPSKTSDLTNDSGYITGIPYGECSTAGGTAAKEVTVTPNITLTAGTMIAVKFVNANSVASSTLNVNSLGAKPIVRYGTTEISTSAATSWNAGSIVLLTYDGTSWTIDNFNNTTYTSMTVAEYQSGTGTTARTITPARLKGAIEYHSTNKTSTSVTISVADWNATTTCTKSVTGVTSSNDVIVTPAPTSLADWSGGGLYCSAQGSDTLTFTCSSTPTVSIDVNALIID